MAERILVVEDDRDLRAFIEDLLGDAGLEIIAYGTAEAAIERLESGEWVDLILTDLILPGARGQQVLAAARRLRPEVNVIVITGFGSIESAIELVKAGAFDYITKPFASDDLMLAIERGLTESRVRREAARAAHAFAATGGFLAATTSVQEIVRSALVVAESDRPILLTGEPGTGRQHLARLIHASSRRSHFVHVRPDDESTDVAADADSTLFVEELTDAVQHPMLRRRILACTVGDGSTPRLIAASTRDLEADTRNGAFPQELFWQLRPLHFPLPPLRERPADIPLLIEHFTHTFARRVQVSPSALSLLGAYPWPGNVRELRTTMERLCLLTTRDVIEPDDLPERIRELGRIGSFVNEAVRRQDTLWALERAYILEVLRSTGGNKSRTAEILGLDRRTLYRKLDEITRQVAAEK